MKTDRLNARWAANEEHFFRECLCIRHKYGGRIIRWDFKAFPAQLKLLKLVKKIRKAGLPIRIIGLKPRQIGLTSGAAGLIYQRTALFPTTLSQIISNDLESVKTIHEKNEVFWSFTHPSMRPMRSRSNQREVVFLNPNVKERESNRGLDSRIYVESAKKITVGRSQTVQNLLGSEVAYWKQGHDRALSVMNSIPEVPGTMVIMESTAQGLGFFWDLWEWTKKPGSIWVPFFFAWHEHPEYQRNVDEHWNADDMDPEELALVATYKVKPEQIAWRRYMIAMKCNASVDLFHQEYPTTAEEAFITSGHSGFDRGRVKAMRGRYEKNGTPLRLYRTPGSSINEIYATHEADSPLKVFSPPQAGRLYVLAVDVAQGLAHGDYSCGQVFDVLAREQVAEFHAHCAPDDLVAVMTMLGWWYNEALLAVENNKDGLYVNAHASTIYPNLYCQERFGQVEQKIANEYGWHTDDPLKRVICHELNNQVKYNRCILHSPGLFDEMMDFERDASGSFGAPPGRHDDRVMAAAIGMWLVIQESIQLAQAQMLSVDDVRIRVPLAGRTAARRQQRQEEDTESWML